MGVVGQAGVSETANSVKIRAALGMIPNRQYPWRVAILELARGRAAGSHYGEGTEATRICTGLHHDLFSSPGGVRGAGGGRGLFAVAEAQGPNRRRFRRERRIAGAP